MIKIREDEHNEYFEDYFEGTPIMFIKNKRTQEICINMDDVANILGLGDNFNEFLGTDTGLDFINEWNKNNPDKAFFGDAVRSIDDINKK